VDRRPAGPPVHGPAHGEIAQRLTDDLRERLSAMASVVRFRKGQRIYRAGDAAEVIYNIVSGVVKSFSIGPDGRERINAFLFADDLFGLAEAGRYTNSAEAITPVTAWRLPVARLESHLHHDARLEFHVICKLCQELRQSQRHAFVVASRDAVPKVAMFLGLLEQLQAGRGEPTNEIHLPMARTEIGDYVGLSLAAVSRAFARLVADGVVATRNRRHVKVVDRSAFARLAGLPNGSSEENV
jgi:CRP-like cAMP-binding protein